LLPVEQRLSQSGAQSVWQATAEQIPHVLLEIGRLRELSFRAANEGTGKSVDLDRFDDHYLHLFIWNAEDSEIVGAYRLGATDRILERQGRQGLYSSTLFDSRMEFFRRLGPALELGRSFVRPEYQRSYSPLLLLWKGIGSFIARHPELVQTFEAGNDHLCVDLDTPDDVAQLEVRLGVSIAGARSGDDGVTAAPGT
jgi:hypothetical protein